MPDYISIRTAQNVAIKYKLAGLGNRFLAKLIDMLIIIGYTLGITVLVSTGVQSWVLIFLFMLPPMMYSLLFEVFNNGITPGKSIMKSKVVSMDGAPLSVRQVLTRWLLLLVDLWTFSGFPGLVAIISTDKQQRIGDMASGTIVISTKNDATLDKTSFKKVYKDYEAIYPEASLLSPQDARIIGTVLADKSDNNYKLTTQAAAKIENILQIKKRDNSREFLRTILKDYNHLQSLNHNDGLQEYEDEYSED